MNGSNITTGIIPTARYLAAVNTSALLQSISQVLGLQGLENAQNTSISSLQSNDTVHDSSILALQGNDTADRAYLNNTFPGSNAITTLGTIATGVWQGTGITAAYISSVNGSNITSGTIPTARYLDAVNTSANLYNVNGSNITSGIIQTARYLDAVNSSAQISRSLVRQE